jgi:hypothetical protein
MAELLAAAIWTRLPEVLQEAPSVNPVESEAREQDIK